MKNVTIRRPVQSAATFVATALIAASAAHGQAVRERESVQLRNDCRLASQTLENGHPAPKSDWALQVIRDCEESAGAALQRVWAAPPADSAALEPLVEASGAMRDQRIYEAVAAVARNAGAAQVVRLSALRVLAAYLDPRKVVDLDDLRPSRDSGAVAWADHAHQLTGSQPLDGAAPARIHALFADLAASDPDPVVRYAGRWLRARFP
ncbi:MAG TPA: hypothetical protein VJL28_05695 [Gemmatimonadaceae bacterium]|nr:hypothetical protein [Gemmatimonadaceae bacterium]